MTEAADLLNSTSPVLNATTTTTTTTPAIATTTTNTNNKIEITSDAEIINDANRLTNSGRNFDDDNFIPPDIPKDHLLVTGRRYRAGRPSADGTITHMELVNQSGADNQIAVGAVADTEDADTFATTKEEEWVTKKKTEVTTTRQIETRVKRQVVLEDGKVVEDSGPIVTTNTTEDTEKQEHEQTEHRTLGALNNADKQNKIDKSNENGDDIALPINNTNTKVSNSVSKELNTDNNYCIIKNVSPPLLNSDGSAIVLKEVKEHRVLSREETEETRETEDVQHFGDITDEQYLAAVHSGDKDIREALVEQSKALETTTGPRLIHQSTRTHKTIDTEDKESKSALDIDGRIITETKRTTEHEVIKDDALSDDNVADIDVVNQCSHNYYKTKDQEHIDYIADGVPIGREMRYTAETAEGERYGDPGMDEPDWDSLSTRMRKARRHQTPNNMSRDNHNLYKRGLDAPNNVIGPLLDRKDALTKRPLDFDQEEETRKEETSKWLEHHFGSDSRSSNNSLDEIEPITPKKTYFNVTIKSKPNHTATISKTETLPAPIVPKSYKATINTSSKTYSASPEQLTKHERYSPYREHNEIHRRHYGSADDLDRDYPRHYNGERTAPKYINGRTSSPSNTPRTHKLRDQDDYCCVNTSTPTPPQRKRGERKQRHSEDSHYDSGYRSQSRNEMSYLSRDNSKEELVPMEEPPPDYSPPPLDEISCSSPSPPLPKDKKLYQRTRFAADIPPTKSKSPENRSSGNIIGQSIRKLVGKIRSASAERKAKAKAKRQQSRSPSPHNHNSPTYQQFNVIDNNIGLESPASNSPSPHHSIRIQGRNNSNNTYDVGGIEIINDKPVLQQQKSRSTLSPTDKFYSSDQNMAERKHQGNNHTITTTRFSALNSNNVNNSTSPVQRYYLGEDPFGGSIYGRENKYDGVKQLKSSRKFHSNQQYPNTKYTINKIYRRESPSDEEISRLHSSTLGRFSKSTSRLTPGNDEVDYSRTAQTLPRNIHHSETTTTYNRNLAHSPPTRLSKNSNSNKINVSIINTVSPPPSIINTGPTKPARTYKSTLLRSKSFNVHGNNQQQSPTSILNLQRNNMSTIYKSNPHLNRLDENHTQLKSPGIVSSISRSQRDINDAIIEEDRKGFTYTTKLNDTNDKRNKFMKGLADRAPELFKTLHGPSEYNDFKRNCYNQSNSDSAYRNANDNYRSNFLRFNNNGYVSPISKIESNYPTVRRGSNGSSDNYSETFHITSKSDDPNNPGFSDTVKSFSKKTVPSKDGRSLETIESTETKTVTKSRYPNKNSGLKYYENGSRLCSSPNGGVVIELRNNHYKK